ncbi:VENN motif pre-toxin domain-containing protein [Neisseria arctica]|uniref:VENN motif pre-toxin domain-containing protein n=1 Tax=Neisseria arctica TaxID=1470200 RepID=UPI00313FFF2A
MNPAKAANTLAPYAAAAIGQQFGHGENKNEAAQILGYFALGATLAYINGSSPASGGSAAVAAEKAAQYLAQQYDDGQTARDPITGEFNANLLPEHIKEEIKSTTGVIASIVGATGDGGSALGAQIGGVIGQNAVENNFYLTENALAKTSREVRNIYKVLKDKVHKECQGGRIQECRQDVKRIIAFAQDTRFSGSYKDLQIESMQFLSDNPKILADYLTAQYEKLSREDKSILHRYITPGAEIVGGASGIVISVKGGAATCAQTFGLTCGAAAVGLASSSDHLITGLSNFGKKASEQRPTVTVQGLKKLGLSEQAANYVQLAVDTLSVGKAGMVGTTGASKVNNLKGVKHTDISKEAPAINEKVSNRNNPSTSNNLNAQAALRAKLSGLQGAQKSAVRITKLPDGRIRYYDKEVPSKKAGYTRGASFVTEYNPNNGHVRQWMENYDKNGNVIQVHPKSINGQVVSGQHYPPTGHEINQGIKK